MTELRGLGWRDDPEFTPTGLSVDDGAPVGALADLPATGMLPREPSPVRDQGADERCTGEVGVGFIYELTGAVCSPVFPWYFARLIDLGITDDPPNVGVSMSAMRSALGRHGACPRELWHRGADGFDRDGMPSAILRIRAQRFNVDVRSIFERGAAAVERVVRELHAGRPVGVVVNVDPPFERPDGAVVGPENGESRGRHIVLARGWLRTPTGVRFSVQNSWGRTWANDGFAWLDESRIRTAPALCVAVGVS